MVLLDWETTGVQMFSEYLEEVYLSSTQEIGTVTGIGSALAAILALFYIGNIIWRSWCNGENINLYAMLRPFCIGLIIINFGLFTKMIDGLMGLLNKPTMVLVEKCSETTQEQLRRVCDNIRESNTFSDPGYNDWVKENEGEIGENASTVSSSSDEGSEEAFFGRLSDTLNSALSPLGRLKDAINGAIVSLLFLCASILGSIAALAILTIGMLTKVILFYIGPFVFALSLIPFFHDAVRNWVGRYITVCLYSPCVNIVNYVMTSIYNKYLTNLADNNSFVDSYQSEAEMYVLIFVAVISVVCYCSIPTIAGFIVNSAGASEITGAAAGVGHSAASIAKVMMSGGASEMGAKMAEKMVNRE